MYRFFRWDVDQAIVLNISSFLKKFRIRVQKYKEPLDFFLICKVYECNFLIAITRAFYFFLSLGTKANEIKQIFLFSSGTPGG